MALIVKGKFACCDTVCSAVPTRVKRMSEPPAERSLPTMRERRSVLEDQSHRCFYCDRPFGSTEIVNGRLRRLKIHWDHVVPFAYARDNSTSNFVASCNICNAWKGALVFETVEHARLYLAGKWERATPTEKINVPNLRE